MAKTFGTPLFWLSAACKSEIVVNSLHVVYSPVLFQLHFNKLKLEADTQGCFRFSRPHHFHDREIGVYMDL